MFECRKTIYSLLMQLHKHFQNGFGIVIEGQSIISLEDSDSEIVEAVMNGTMAIHVDRTGSAKLAPKECVVMDGRESVNNHVPIAEYLRIFNRFGIFRGQSLLKCLLSG